MNVPVWFLRNALSLVLCIVFLRSPFVFNALTLCLGHLRRGCGWQKRCTHPCDTPPTSRHPCTGFASLELRKKLSANSPFFLCECFTPCPFFFATTFPFFCCYLILKTRTQAVWDFNAPDTDDESLFESRSPLETPPISHRTRSSLRKTDMELTSSPTSDLETFDILDYPPPPLPPPSREERKEDYRKDEPMLSYEEIDNLLAEYEEETGFSLRRPLFSLCFSSSFCRLLSP